MVYDVWRGFFALLLVILLIVYLKSFLKYLMFGRVSFSSQEPPQVLPAVPYIGHLIGIFWYKNFYYTKLRYVVVFERD